MALPAASFDPATTSRPLTPAPAPALTSAPATAPAPAPAPVPAPAHARPRARPRPRAPTNAHTPTRGPGPGPGPGPSSAPAPASLLVPASVSRTPIPAPALPINSAPGVTPPLDDNSGSSPVTQNTAPALFVEATSYSDTFVQVEDTAGTATASGSSGGPPTSSTDGAGNSGVPGDSENGLTALGARKKPSKKAKAIKEAKAKKYDGR